LQTDAIGLTALALVMIAWLIFGLAFVLRRRSTNGSRRPMKLRRLAIHSSPQGIVSFHQGVIPWLPEATEGSQPHRRRKITDAQHQRLITL